MISGESRSAQYRDIAARMRRRIIIYMVNKRRNVPADAQFAEGGKTTPEQDASFEALMSELDEYRLGVAEGRIKPIVLTPEQELLGRHMQA